jgi:chromosome partitioning protein
LHWPALIKNDGIRVDVLSRYDRETQGSVLEWSSRRKGTPPFQVVGISQPVLHRDIAMYASDVDVVIIDGIGKASASTQSGIAASDVCIIPVQPSPYDVWAAQDTIQLAQEAKVINSNTKLTFLINAVVATTQIGKTVKKALDESGVSVLKTTIGRRVSFINSATQGMTALETEPNGKAAQEVIALVDEIIEKYADDEIKMKVKNTRGII